jgi:hypothetical protein
VYTSSSSFQEQKPHSINNKEILRSATSGRRPKIMQINLRLARITSMDRTLPITICLFRLHTINLNTLHHHD